MKFLDNFNLKFLYKFSILEKILFLLIVLCIILFISNLNLQNTEGFVEKREKFDKRLGIDIFDDFYVSIYDDLVFNNIKNTYEVEEIINTSEPTNNSKILDIGSGTGHHVNMLTKKNIEAIGIDLSPSMVNQSKLNYPDINVKVGDVLNSMEFTKDEFTHISCLYFTIYYIKDKRRFFENCFNWLAPGGVLILHLVDIANFDAILPISDPFTMLNVQDYSNKRITNSTVNFDKMTYKSDFDINFDNSASTKIEKPNGVFKEIMKFNDDTVRINEHQFYMNTQSTILSIAKDIGFIEKGYSEMKDIQYEHNYLYWLYKPQ